MSSRLFARLALVAAAAALIVSSRAQAQADPSKILGPDTCATCHKQETAAWHEMKHYKTFAELPRDPDAKTIAAAMGVGNIKTEGMCVKCHFTSQTVDGSTKAIAGVSCELCHGAAADWVKIHNQKGQIPAAEKLGFISPDNIYRLAANCFQCHTVPDEKLVNTGKHHAGSEGFDLVSWTQGEMRHHFLDGKNVNAVATPDRQRMLYLIGRLVDLEFSVRAVAGAVERGNFVATMNASVKNDLKLLQAMADKLPTGTAKTDVLAAIAAVPAVKPAADGATGIKIVNKDDLLAAADTLSKLGQKMSDTYQGSDLAALDPLLPTVFKGTPFVPSP